MASASTTKCVLRKRKNRRPSRAIYQRHFQRPGNVIEGARAAMEHRWRVLGTFNIYRVIDRQVPRRDLGLRDWVVVQSGMV
jgi:hypothetical protein